MDTSTSFLGCRLPHPFIAGASPLGFDLDTIKQLEDGGCAAVVIPSLFEEQITLASTGRIHQRDPFQAEWAAGLAPFPGAKDYRLSPEEYAAHIAAAKRAVAIPIIASLNGANGQSWLTFSRIIEQAGANALELNLYQVVTDLRISGNVVEHELASTVRELKRTLKIPLAVKVSPFHAAFGHVARQLDQAGADAIVLFNRFYQPDIDVTTMKPTPRVVLSTSADLLLRLRWLAILHGRVRPTLVVTGGIATPEDGIKALLAGAEVVEMVSAILRKGPTYFAVMREGLEHWMEQHLFSCLTEVCGLASLQQTVDPAAFERANYIRTLQSWSA
jgi:dihydroorotate dehydrogenase (fumarate)